MVTQSQSDFQPSRVIFKSCMVSLEVCKSVNTSRQRTDFCAEITYVRHRISFIHYAALNYVYR